MRKKIRISTIIFVFICGFSLIFRAGTSFSAEEKGAGVKTTVVGSSGTGVTEPEQKSPEGADKTAEDKDKEIEKLKEKEKETLDEIKQKEEAIIEVVEKAEEVLEEKQTVKEEATIKEQEAAIAKEKHEAVQKKAEITGDADAAREAEKLAAEAEQLKEEADVSKEKLKKVELEEKLAEERIAANQKKIEELKQALANVKREKIAKRSFLEKALMSAVIIFAGLILFILLKLGARKFETLITKKDVIREDEITLRMKTLTKLINWLGGLLIVIVVLYMILENFGFSVAPLLAGAGIVGLAFGFGGQYLIRDLINGLFVLVEGQYRINDVVKIGEYGGLVENINLRITTLRDLAGRVIIVPNGEIKTVVNYTREYAQALLNIGVAYKENVDRVMDVIKQVGKEMRGDEYFSKLILGDLEMFGVDDFADSAVMIKFRIKTLPIKQWEVMREFRRRLKNRFDELGIEIPFPHRTLYWGAGEDNQWLKKSMEKIAKPKK